LVANRTAAHVQDQVEALDEVALASFMSLHNKVDAVDYKVLDAADSRLGRGENSLGIIQNSVQGVPACLTQISNRLFRLEGGIDNGGGTASSSTVAAASKNTGQILVEYRSNIS
jgi:hypothetical protein